MAPQSGPGAKQQAQANNPQAQQHQQALTAAGCPPQSAATIAAKLAPQGVDPQHVAQLAQLGPSFNWGALESLIIQYGPSIIGSLIHLFGVGGQGGQGSQPQPQPAP